LDLTRLGQETVGEYGSNRAMGHSNVTLSVPKPAAVGLKSLEHGPLLEATGQMDDVSYRFPSPFDPAERQNMIEWVAHSTPTLGFARNPHGLIG